MAKRITPIDILKLICNNTVLQKLVYIKAFYTKGENISKVTGWYKSKNRGIYFHGKDEIGMNFIYHYGQLRIDDYRGNSRELIRKIEGDSISWDLRLDLSKALSIQRWEYPVEDHLYFLSIDPSKWLSGDLFIPKDNKEEVHILYQIGEISDKVEVHYFNTSTKTLEKALYNHLEDLEGHIFTLVPHKKIPQVTE